MKCNLEILENVSNVSGDNNRKTYLYKQALATAASCLISLSSGFTLGISAMMLPQLRNDDSIQYDSSHESWIASISVVSMIIGSLSSGTIMDSYGRKVAHIFIEVPFIIGWIVIACANSTTIILIGRFITGLSAGANRPVTMVYIGEISDPRIRAAALFTPGLLTPFGVWTSHVIGNYLGWRFSSIIFIVPSVISLVAFLFLKESPLWLIAKGRTRDGVENFRWFRGTDEKSEAELKSVLEKHSEKTEMPATKILNVMCSKAFVKPMLILLVMMINVQISGINAMSFYSQDIFEKVFTGTIDPFVMTMAMDGIRNFICFIICVVGNSVPRKLTFLITDFGVTIFSFGLIVCFKIKMTWVSVSCLVMFVLCSSTGMVIGFTYVPELLPTSARGLGSGLNSTFSFITLFITVKIIPDIIQKFDVMGLFVYFGTGTFITGLILSLTLPETNGKTLQSLENSHDKKKTEPNVS